MEMQHTIFKESETEQMDQYTASIELSNKCREFYHRRLETAESVKRRLCPTTTAPNGRKKSSLDLAFEKLGKEMSSLMDTDLSLMKQLLMMNESIEELKWKRINSYESVDDSSEELSASDSSISDTDMFASDFELSNEKSQHDDLINDFSEKCSVQEFDKIEVGNCSTPKMSRKHVIANNIYKQTSLEDLSSDDSGIDEASDIELDS